MNNKNITIHVDFTQPDDTGDGSPGSPYKTYQAALNSAGPGDVIGLGNNAAHVLSAAVDWTTVGAPPTSTQPILTTTWDNATSGNRAVVDCNAGAYGIWANVSSHAILDFVEIRNTTTYAVTTNATAVQIHRVKATDTCAGGLSLTGSASRCFNSEFSATDITLRALSQGANGDVRDCIFKHSGNLGAAQYAVYINASATGFANNAIHLTGTGSGIALQMTGTANHSMVQNNTIVGTTQNGVGIKIGTGQESVTLINNVVVDLATGIDFNNQRLAYGGRNSIYNCTAAVANLASGQEFDIANDTTTNPQVADPANNDFKIGESTFQSNVGNPNLSWGSDQTGAAGGGGGGDATEANQVAILAQLDGIEGTNFQTGTHSLDQMATTTEIADAVLTDPRAIRYAAHIEYDMITGGSVDKASVQFVESGEPISDPENITTPTITVIDRDTEQVLANGVALTQVGSSAWYKADISTKVADGSMALITVSATYGGGTIQGLRTVAKFQ